MELFIVQSGAVIPTEETLLIYPYKDMWERDKDMALKEFTYIEFLCSYKKTNPYIGYKEDIRSQKIIDGIFKAFPDWMPDHLVLEGIRIYNDFQNEASPSLRFYKAALKGVEQLQDYYTTLNMKDKNLKSGMPINNPAAVSRGLSQTAGILQNLETLKEKVEQELIQSNKVRANRVVNAFER